MAPFELPIGEVMKYAGERLGVTLIELLVVMAIVAVLMALLFPAIQMAREAARRTQCRNQLRNIALAMHNYSDVSAGYLPSGTDFDGPSSAPLLWSWQMKLLPYVGTYDFDGKDLYNKFDNRAGIVGATNRPLLASEVSFLRCPSDPNGGMFHDESGGLFAARWSLTNYLGSSGTSAVQYAGDGAVLSPAQCSRLRKEFGGRADDGVLYGGSAVNRRDITDGEATTLLAGERGVDVTSGRGWWTGPGLADSCPAGWADVVLPTEDSFGLAGLYVQRHTSDDVFHWWSYHPGCSIFAMVDGSAHAIDYKIDKVVIRALSTRAGREHVLEP